jgi:ATP-dependent DNA ligase
MLARLDDELPRGPHIYEPKWDGFRAVAFRDGDWAELQSRNLNRFGRYFPELVDGLRAIAEKRFVIDGEIVIVGEDGFDFAALLMRLHPSATRVERLRRETPAQFIAFDVLAIGGEDLRQQPFVERRRRLEELLAHAPNPIHITPATHRREVALGWLERSTGSGVDGVVAKSHDLRYDAGKRSMVKVKPERTADCVVAGFRATHDGVAALLLGLYDSDGLLRHIGVASSFNRARRRELLDRLRPLIGPLEGHPWEKGFVIGRSPMGRLRGAAGLWTPDLPLDWVPVRPELVCEVSYGQVDVDRLRHPAQFRRWRPDRDAASCELHQLSADSQEPSRALSAWGGKLGTQMKLQGVSGGTRR